MIYVDLFLFRMIYDDLCWLNNSTFMYDEYGDL